MVVYARFLSINKPTMAIAMIIAITPIAITIVTSDVVAYPMLTGVGVAVACASPTFIAVSALEP